MSKLSPRLSRAIAALVATLALLTSTLVIAPGASAADIDEVKPDNNQSKYVEGTDPAAWLFDPLRVHRIDITISQNSYNILNSSSYNNKAEYQAGTMKFTTDTGVVVSSGDEVGVRLKGGWGSFRNLDQKAAFKIKTNFVKGENFFGLKKLTLNNMVQDPSMLHEATVYRLYRAMGVPAPRVGYVTVYVNGVNYGLHANIETYDDVMLKRWMPSTKNLYEGAYFQDVILGQYNDIEADEGDAFDRTDLRGLATINDQQFGSAWYNEWIRVVDAEQFINEWAVERYVAHWDGYSWTIKNNYYLHTDSEGVFSLFPWGSDQTLLGHLPFLATDNVGVMFTKCIQYSPCQQTYKGALYKVHAVAQTLQLGQMMDDIWGAIDGYVLQDPRKERSYEEARGTVQASKDFLAQREWNLNNEIGFDKNTNLEVSYSFEKLEVGATALPQVTRDGGTGSISYKVVGGNANCSVNFTTGLLRIDKIGYCRVMARAAATLGWAASLDVDTFYMTQASGSVAITPIAGIVYDTEEALEFSALSTAQPAISVSGPCTYGNGFVRATSGQGTCRVTVDVPEDDAYTAASAFIDIPLIKGEGQPVTLTTSQEYKGKLPKGGSIALTKIPNAVAGPCKLVATKLVANAATGKCTLTWIEYETANFVYPETVHEVTLGTGTQSFASTVSKAATLTKKKNNRVLLSKVASPITNLGASTTWVTNGQCKITTSGNNVYAAVKAKTTCRVSLKSKSIFGLPVITRSWVIGY